MSTVWIYIKGLGICYRRQNAWRIRFVCDNDHVLLMDARRPNGTQIFDPVPLRSARSIEVVIKGGLGQNALTLPDFNNVFDLTGQYAHQGGVRSTKKPGKGVRAVDVKIPDVAGSNAVFCTAKMTSRPYLVRNRATSVEKPLGLVALVVGAKIDLAEGGAVSFRVDGVKLPQKDFPSGTTIILDNDCLGNGPKNARKRKGDKFGGLVEGSDFNLYYHVIEDASGNGVEYEVEAYAMPGTKAAKFGRVNCYAVQASDPDGLIPSLTETEETTS